MTTPRETRIALEARILRAPPGDARKAALDAYLEAVGRDLLAVCLHLTDHWQDAEDAFQETCVALYRGLDRFRGESRLYTWLYRTAIRIASRIKARGARRPASLDVEPEAHPSRDSVADRENTETILWAIQSLPVAHRATLSLFALEGLAPEEVAEVLGVPVGTVWSRLHTARTRLAERLETGGSTRPDEGRADGHAADGRSS